MDTITDKQTRFRAKYIEVLTQAVKIYPKNFDFGVDDVPAVVERRMPGILAGCCIVGDTLKEVANSLKISPPSAWKIQEYLTT